MKEDWKPGTMIYPLPAVLVSCGSTPEEYNILTIAWTGTICTNPPMCYISVRPERYSYDIIKRNMEFVINLTTKDMARATDWCGVRSGKSYNKFEEMKLTPGKSTVVHRMSGKGNSCSRFARHVHSRRRKCTCRHLPFEYGDG